LEKEIEDKLARYRSWIKWLVTTTVVGAATAIYEFITRK
jgi:hypothetical protein